MSTSNPEARMSLEIRCADSATEIFVIDGQFSLRDRGIGYLKTLLEPGLYKVKVRAGFETREQPVILRERQTIDIPRFDFVSPAPLEATSKTHEFHIGAAANGSRNVDLSAGKGSSIFILVRDWTNKEHPKEMLSSYPNPARGLSLRNLQGDVIADLTTQGKRSDEWDPWASCNVEINPGAYLLNLETSSGETLQQTIVASIGWQTQVFLLQRSYEDGPDSKRADLQSAAILMSPQGQGFNPGDDTARLAELARLGLCNARRVLADDVRQMLANKFENPMLGIFAAHLLLLDKEPDLVLLNTVINNLRMLLPGGHPDVEALSLALNPEAAHMFDVPPMLRKSWTLIVKTTAKRTDDIIPDESLAGKIATHLWGSHPWLIWMKAEETDSDQEMGAHAAGLDSQPAPALSNVEVVLQSLLSAGSEPFELTVETERRDSPFAAINKMRSARAQDEPQPSESTSQALSMGGDEPELPMMAQPDEAELDKLVQSLNLPRKTLEKMIARLNASPRAR